MNDSKIIIAIAKLDGFKEHPKHHYFRNDDINGERFHDSFKFPDHAPDYLTSRDAIISVIEKQGIHHQLEMIEWLATQKLTGADRFSEVHNFALEILKATPKQLCIALLKATGKWEE